MAFLLAARPPSPSPRDTDADALSAALHAALQPLSNASGLPTNPQPGTQSPHPTYTPHSDDMQLREKGDKGHPFVDISVNTDTLILRGTGVDVEPALLSGNVVLYLSEPASIKEIQLQFRGKARIPPSANESLALNSNLLSYIVCNHEWSFLEGNKSHAHTLKAGRHLFPFQLHIGGSLPSSVSTTALGGASVHYKLRATVVRPMGFGLSHRDLHAVHPIHIVRGFGSEALEYQQTLEIENTWPEKLMYSIMIPHKAWAAGDRVTAVVKFQPLVKGARVQSVNTMVNETVKLSGRGGMQETTRTIASTKHEFFGKDAVCVDDQEIRHRIPLLHHHAHVRSPHGSISRTGSFSTHSPAAGAQSSASSAVLPAPTSTMTHSPGDMTPLTTVTTNSSSSSSASGSAATSSGRPSGSSSGTSLPRPSVDVEAHPSLGIELPPELESEPSSDVVTTLHIQVPPQATPSHTLEPIQVSHRIRWSIMIANFDGHTSELRCSLPIHVLDHRLYEEAHAATIQTRRLLLGASDVEGGQAVGTHGEASDDEDLELPSYPAHVRDRVANAFLPENGVLRVTNPWVAHGISPVLGRGNSDSHNNATRGRSSHSGSSSGVQSPAPMECYPVNGNGDAAREVRDANGILISSNPRSQLPHVPSPDTQQQQLHWVNSELLLSLSDQPDTYSAEQTRHSPGHARSPPESAGGSRHGSRFSSRRGSRANSRANSRAASPERGDSASVASSAASSAETFVHNSNTASRNLQGLFHISMKPFTSLTSNLLPGHRSASTSAIAPQAHGAAHPGSPLSNGRVSSGASTPTSSGMNTPAQVVALPRRHLTQDQILLHRAFTETPDYETASRGFLGGGVPPLSSYQGLPSYEEAAQVDGHASLERCRSEPDIVGRLHERDVASIHSQLSPSHSPSRQLPTRTEAQPRHSSEA